MTEQQDVPITEPIRKFKRRSGLGTTKIYQMINAGDLKSIKIGKRRLIVVDSYRQLVDKAAV